MKCTKKLIAITLLPVVLTACVSLPTLENDQSDAKECSKNFTVTGSNLSLTGKEFKTQAFVAGVNKNDAMLRASKKLAEDGLRVGTVEKEAGFLTASNKAVGGRGSQDDASLYMSFEQGKGGVSVSMRFKTGFGQVSSEENMKFNLCAVMDAIAATNTTAIKEPPNKAKEPTNKKATSPVSAKPVVSNTSPNKEKPRTKKDDGPIPNFKDFSSSK